MLFSTLPNLSHTLSHTPSLLRADSLTHTLSLCRFLTASLPISTHLTLSHTLSLTLFLSHADSLTRPLSRCPSLTASLPDAVENAPHLKPLEWNQILFFAALYLYWTSPPSGATAVQVNGLKNAVWSYSDGWWKYRLLPVFDAVENVPLLEQHRLYQLPIRPVRGQISYDQTFNFQKNLAIKFSKQHKHYYQY